MSKKAPPPNFLYRVKVYSNERPPWSKFCVASAPINGMPHLAYLGSMLEKRRGGICHQSLPHGIGTQLELSQSTQLIYAFSF